MSTRAIYSFTDEHDTYHVYKHHDGYPAGAAEFIGATLGNSWKLPRFEADEFAAAFVASNKKCEGDIRLLRTGSWQDVAPLDIEYRYEVTAANKVLQVVAFAVSYHSRWTVQWSESMLFRGSLAEFEIFTKKDGA